jgi:hypothetical protein
VSVLSKRIVIGFGFIAIMFMLLCAEYVYRDSHRPNPPTNIKAVIDATTQH